MKEVKRLIFRIFTYLEIIETPKNQPMIQEIRGLIYEILDLISKNED